jgi:hypothetical protein
VTEERNTLSNYTKYKLARHIDEHKSTLARLTYKQIAQKVSGALGVKLTEQNIAAAYATLGIRRRAVRNTLTRNSTHDNFRTTARWVSEIYELLGESVPEDVKEVRNR